jgi:hypothetical protein
MLNINLLYVISPGISSGKTLRSFLFFRRFNLYNEASNNYKLIIVKISCPFLCVNSTSIDFHYAIFSKYDLEFNTVSMFVIINTEEY